MICLISILDIINYIFQVIINNRYVFLSSRMTLLLIYVGIFGLAATRVGSRE